MKYAVIIAAGGSGKRFGRAGGKQLLSVDGKPIVIRTIEKFYGQVDQLIVVIQQSDIHPLQEYLKHFNLTNIEIVASGSQRYDSVRNGLNVLSADIDAVLIHDGARPKVTLELINRVKQSLETHPAVIPVVPVTDTIKVVQDGRVLATPARASLFAVQTPQGFQVKELKAAYAKVELKDCTDDAMVMERAGRPVFVVDGERTNIKVTTPEDLYFLQDAVR